MLVQSSTNHKLAVGIWENIFLQALNTQAHSWLMTVHAVQFPSPEKDVLIKEESIYESLLFQGLPHRSLIVVNI